MKPKLPLRSFLIACGSLFAANLAHAVDLYWDGNGTTAGAGATPTGTWGVDNFWNTDSTGGAAGTFQIPTLSTDDLFFSAGTDAVNPYAISLNTATQNARRVTFEDGTATLSTGTLSLGNSGGITVTSGTVTGATISSDLTISGIQTFNVAASRTLTLDTGTFTRNAGATLNVLSTGTVNTTMTGLATGSLVNGIIGPWASYGTGASTRYATIDGSNNIVAYTGGTAAATAAGVTSTLGTINYDVAGGNATLGAGANINTLRYTGGGATIGGALTTKGIMNVGGGTVTFSGAVTGSGELVVNSANGTVSFGAATAAGSYGLVKDGPGRLNLANSDTTYSGTVTVNGGVLFYGDNPGRLTSGNVTLNGGVIEQRWNAGFTKTQGSGAGQIQILGGESGFSQNGNTGYTVNIGAITWGSATFNPTKFVLQTSTSQGNSTVTIASASTFNLGGATRTILVNSGVTGNASATIQGAISNGGLVKEGAGLLNLTATNTYNGGTTISAGTLAFGGIATMPNAGVVAVASGTTLGINLGGTGNWTTGTSGVGTLGGLLAGVGGAGTSTVTYTGNVGLRLNMGANSTYSGNIGNVGTTLALTKIGGSSLTLSGNNSYTGGTFIQQGTLSANSANALGTAGDITFTGGTLQYTANSAANDYGSRIKNSTSAMLLNTNGQNVSLSNLGSGNTAGLDKQGSGTLTLTGTNTFGGLLDVSTGTVVVDGGTTTANQLGMTGSSTTLSVINGGTLNATGGNFEIANSTDNTYISIIGGASTSTLNLGTGRNFSNLGYNPPRDNKDMLIDGDGIIGSAVFVAQDVEWGRSTLNSDLVVTDGGLMNIRDLRIGSTYYGETGINNTVTLGGGTALSVINSSQDVYVGYGDRAAASSNTLTVGANGDLNVTRHMYVGHVNQTANSDNPSTANQLTVTGGGTANMNQLSLGFADADGRDAGANIVEVTSSGQLSTSGTTYIGRADNPTSTSNANTLTVSGTGSSWNAGNQTVYVGHTNNASAQSNNNILTIGTGGSLTNVSNLIVGFGTGTETGNQLVLNGGSLTATTVTVQASNSIEFGVNGGTLSGNITNNGSINIGSNVAVSLAGNISGSGGITQSGTGTTSLSGDNSYTGATAINGGTLEIAGAGDINSTSSITVAGGASFVYNSSTALAITPTLNGSGSSKAVFSGSGNLGTVALTLNSLDDVLSPGNSPGIQSFGTSQTWSSFSYDWELNDWAASVTGTNIDQIQISGTLDLDGAAYALNILSLDSLNAAGLVGAGGGNPFAEVSNSWTILTTSGGISNFNALEWTINAGGFLDAETGNWGLNQVGNDLVLSYTAIPEPSSALLVGLSSLLFFRRRR